MSDLLQVRDLHVAFVTPDRTVHAVNGVSFDVKRGETLGILGRIGLGQERHLCARSCGSIPSIARAGRAASAWRATKCWRWARAPWVTCVAGGWP